MPNPIDLFGTGISTDRSNDTRSCIDATFNGTVERETRQCRGRSAGFGEEQTGCRRSASSCPLGQNLYPAGTSLVSSIETADSQPPLRDNSSLGRIRG